MRECQKCKVSQPEAEFNKSSARKDGLQAWCKACMREAGRQYQRRHAERRRAKDRARYWANPERAKEEAKRYYEANAEARRVYAAQYRATNPEKAKASQRKYRESHPEQHIAQEHLRRARRTGVQIVETVMPNVVFERDGGICGICREVVFEQDRTIDHIIPISKGGEHSYANTQLAHRRCNEVKHTTLPEHLATMEASYV